MRFTLLLFLAAVALLTYTSAIEARGGKGGGAGKGGSKGGGATSTHKTYSASSYKPRGSSSEYAHSTDTKPKKHKEDVTIAVLIICFAVFFVICSIC